MEWLLTNSTRTLAVCGLILGVAYSVFSSLERPTPRESQQDAGHPRVSVPADASYATLGREMGRLLDGVVSLETLDRRTERVALGTGFVIDNQGTVATCLHVIKEAERIEAVFRDGSRLTPKGILAADASLDLALLQLDPQARTWSPLDLAENPAPRTLDLVVSVGHPHGLAFSALDGRVSRAIRTSELPLDSHRFVNFVLGGDKDHQWIQHTSRITDGNSGGPLLDAQGRVIGVNAWINSESGLSYALSVEHLREFIARRRGELMTLAEMRSILFSPQAALLPSIAEATRIWRDLVRQGEPASSSARKRDLGVLARAVSIPIASLPTDEERELLNGLRNEILQTISSDGQGGPVFLDQLGRDLPMHGLPASQGLVAVSTRLRTVRGEHGQQAILATVAGSEFDLLLPLSADARFSSLTKRHLIFGVLSDEVIPYGSNPLDRRLARVLSLSWYCPIPD